MQRSIVVAILMLFGLSASAESPAPAPGCDQSAAQVYRNVAPSVVRVYSVAIDPFSLAKRVRQGVGSGVVIEGGNVVTNAHVVYEASEIVIVMEDGVILGAVAVGIDELSDLAIIRPASFDLPAPAATFGDSDSLEVGTDVMAIGYPLGFEKSISRGIVSGVDRIIPMTPSSWQTPLIQIDAPISPGNSGGPLVNRCGEVVGINTYASKLGQAVNFSIPINLVRQLLPDLLEHGRVLRPWHGVYGRPVPPILQYTMGLPAGLMVETIEPGSPAETVGLRGGKLPIRSGLAEFLLGGDIITQVGGTKLTDLDTVARVVRAFRVGDRVDIEYWRDGSTRHAVVTLPERPVFARDGLRFVERGN